MNKPQVSRLVEIFTLASISEIISNVNEQVYGVGAGESTSKEGTVAARGRVHR